MIQKIFKLHKKVTIIACALASGAYADTQKTQDPYESYNRQVFHFNNTVDKTLLKPLAFAYNAVTPHVLQQGITHFFANLFMPRAIINDMLQAKWSLTLIDLKRFATNTTLGVAGFFDVATALHIPKHENDFGTTFAYWTGNYTSTYTVLPFFGPSTFRDTAAMPFDTAANPLVYCKSDLVSYGSSTLYFVNARAQLLSTDLLLDNAFDPYAAMRSAYLQKRDASIAANLNVAPPLPRHSESKDRKLSNGDQAS